MRVSPTPASSLNDGSDEDRKSPAEDLPERQRNLRIAKELGRHVWPPLPGGSNAEERENVTSMRRRVTASIGLMLAGKGVTIATPYLFKGLVDSLPMYSNRESLDVTAQLPSYLPDGLVETLSSSSLVGLPALPAVLLLSYGTSRTLSSLFQESRNALFATVAQRAIRSVGRQTFDHVHSLDMQFHLDRNTGTLGRIIERGNRSISFILNAMVFNTVPTIIEVGVVTGCLTYQFGPSHGATVLATIGAYVGYTVAMTQWRTPFRVTMNKMENKASGRISDSLLNYETVKYFNNEGHEGRMFESTLKGYQDASLKTSYSLAMLNFGQSAIFTAGLTTIMYLTAVDVVAGTATFGDLVLVNGLLFQLSVPLNFIGGIYRTVQQSFVDMEAMFRLRDTKAAVVDKIGAVDYNPAEDGCEIEFNKLEFAYKLRSDEDEECGKRRPILRGTTFTVPQGKTVAVVGTSGCGKSTLMRLLYRFYSSDKGCIRIGNRDISDYTIDSVRRSIAVVPQDIVLFNDTIGYNINYGNLAASQDDVVKAAKKAHLHEIIKRLPDGYETVVGERGLKLSGGEKQRVSLARAILKRAPILLCDEPTSSLDSHTELEIMNNLKEIGGEDDTTCVIIAHRLSTVQDCDAIVVMDQGKVVEMGTHEELMRKRGRYSELVSFQRSCEVGDALQ